jgi:hypothetical protein
MTTDPTTSTHHRPREVVVRAWTAFAGLSTIQFLVYFAGALCIIALGVIFGSAIGTLINNLT